MSEYKELYLPFYFSWGYMTEELTSAELGDLLRALINNYSERRVPSELPEKMRIIYKFMLDGAVRTHSSQRELSEKRRESANKRWAKSNEQNDANLCKPMQTDAINGNGKENVNENGNVNGNGNGNGNISKRSAEKATKRRYGNFDPEEAFNNALKRTYGETVKLD